MNAHDLFNAIFNASLAVMVISLVAALGMGLTVRQVVAPMRRVWLLLGAIVVNVVVAPLIAIGICHLFPLSSEARIGLELVTVASAGPAGMKACQFTKRADMAMALSFTIVLQLVNILAAPIWAKQIISGATVSVWSILGDLLLLVLAPLVVGLVVRARYPEHAGGWKPALEKISNVALLIAIAVGLAVNWKLVVSSVGSWVILASTLIVIAYIAVGWVVGLGDRQVAPTISLVTAMRFTPIGLVVIASVLKNQGAYLMPGLIFALVDTVIPFVAGIEIGRATGRVGTKAAASARSHPTPTPPVARPAS